MNRTLRPDPLPALFYLVLLSLACASTALAQAARGSLASNFAVSDDGERLVRQQRRGDGLYALDTVRVIDLLFDEDRWFSRVRNGGLHGSLVCGGDTLRDVFVEVKGSGTDILNPTLKKSYNVELDAVHGGQDLGGYTSLNLHGGAFDPSHVREVLFYEAAGRHLPSVQASLVELRVNGASRGAYINTQQIDRDFLREWFGDASGPRWRAESPDGRVPQASYCAPPPPIGRPPAPSAFHYLGPDSADYGYYYIEKGPHERGSWDHLVAFNTKLNFLPDEQLLDSLPRYLNIDEALWFLAHEILFADEDGYVLKTQSDFLVYHEPATGQMIPLEYDGNDVFQERNIGWPVDFRASEPCVPLVHRLLSVPRWRQRYLAHARTLLRESLDPTALATRAAELRAGIDALERNDPIGDQLYTYDEFLADGPELNRIIGERHAFLADQPGMTPPDFAVAAHHHGPVETGGESSGAHVTAGQQVAITAHIEGGAHGPAYVHMAGDVREGGGKVRFRENRLYDDGQHGDSAAGDGVYGAFVTAGEVGSLVRYYFEVTGAAADAPSLIYPYGGEHDTYFFPVVGAAAGAGPLYLNEFVADNETGATDEAGENEDWLELYNASDAPVSLAGYTLSDDGARPDKWAFPADASVPAGGYLVVWCDEDQEDGPLHANFKLSKGGESVDLFDANGARADAVTFPALSGDEAYARRTDGGADLVIQAPTFAADNAGATAVPGAAPFPGLRIYPTVAAAGVARVLEAPVGVREVTVASAIGRETVAVKRVDPATPTRESLALAPLPVGIYLVTARGDAGVQTLRIVVR